MNLVWNVYRHDGNTIKPFNVFDHGGIQKDVEKLLKSKNIDKSDFENELNKSLIYYYWCKAEHEIILRQWVGTECEVKVDVYNQVRLNWPQFVDYVWNAKHNKSKEVS